MRCDLQRLCLAELIWRNEHTNTYILITDSIELQIACSVSVPADVDQQRQATRTNEQ